MPMWWKKERGVSLEALFAPSVVAWGDVGGGGQRIEELCSIALLLNSRSHHYNQRIEEMVQSPLRLIFLLLAVISGKKMVETDF
jgi:hypothetical protein